MKPFSSYIHIPKWTKLFNFKVKFVLEYNPMPISDYIHPVMQLQNSDQLTQLNIHRHGIRILTLFDCLLPAERQAKNFIIWNLNMYFKQTIRNLYIFSLYFILFSMRNCWKMFIHFFSNNYFNFQNSFLRWGKNKGRNEKFTLFTSDKMVELGCLFECSY